MIPTLPGDDAGARQAALEASRADYRYSYYWPAGVAMPEKVQFGDSFLAHPVYSAEVSSLNLDNIRNQSNIDLDSVDADAQDELHDQARAVFEGGSPLSRAEDFFLSTSGCRAFPRTTPGVVEEYLCYYATREEPELVRRLRETDLTGTDVYFAWQRLAGANPMTIVRCDELPDHFPVTEAHFRAAVGEGDSLAAALEAGRVFLADYGMLDGAPAGTCRGRKKYFTAPLALFAQVDGAFLPIAIQLHQRPSELHPIVTPADGVRWNVARHFVQIADANVHESIVHLGQTHLVMGAVTMAMKRQLAASHPVRVLLEPHTVLTLAINDMARNSLIAVDGLVDQIMACTIEGTIAAVAAGVETFDFTETPEQALHRRGLMDTEALPNFPYRDDGLRVWQPTRDWVRDYLKVYYPTREAIAADGELRAFLTELGAPEGGRMRRVGPVTDFEALVDLVATMIFTASAQHSAVNFPQYPFMGYVPNMPGAAWAPPPPLNRELEFSDYMNILPPWDMTIAAHDAVYQLSAARTNILGDYGLGYFDDTRVRVSLDLFRDDLSRLETAIQDDNHRRVMPYPYLLPSTIPASIHI